MSQLAFLDRVLRAAGALLIAVGLAASAARTTTAATPAA